jgi:hypothetical protein
MTLVLSAAQLTHHTINPTDVLAVEISNVMHVTAYGWSQCVRACTVEIVVPAGMTVGASFWTRTKGVPLTLKLKGYPHCQGHPLKTILEESADSSVGRCAHCLAETEAAGCCDLLQQAPVCYNVVL